MEIYLYTKTPNGGFKEYLALLGSRRGCCGGQTARDTASSRWWTDLSLEEGVVRRCSVWFREPNAKRAKELLNMKGVDMAIDYIEKSTNAFQRSKQ